MKSHNGKLRRKREEEENSEGDGSNKRSRVVTPRRSVAETKNDKSDNKNKTIRFKDDDSAMEKIENNNTPDHDAGHPKDRNITRRGALTFQTKNNQE